MILTVFMLVVVLVDIKWDNWQLQVLEHDGSLTMRCGRQVGKSEVVSEKALRLARDHPGTSCMIIAASQRQSSLLFEKVHARCADSPDVDFLDKPTMTKILLTNGSRIYCMPTGRTGHFIRGFTIDFLIADEAAFIPEMVWLAIEPTIAVSRSTRGFGWIILLSTPFGKGGYFYNSFLDDDFRSWHISSESCKRISKSFLSKKRKSMSKMQYAQEWLGEFVDEYRQLFPTALLKERMSFIDWSLKEKELGSGFYLGVDVARYGGDENAFVICELQGKKLKVVKCHTTERVSTTDTIGRIVEFDRIYGFKRVFIDDAGVGGGVTDVLIERLGRRVVGLNNSSKRFVMAGEEHKKGILKEDLYSNVLMLLETGRLDMISDLDLLRSLKSITYEYNDSGRLKIQGSYSHLAEALVRSCWCVKDKGLNLYLF